MPPLIPYNWRTDPEYINLLNFLIERTEYVESPMCIKRLARDFKEKSGAALTVKCHQHRIERARKIIHSFEHIDTKKKVKMQFALSASVIPEFLKELEKDAFVEVDEKNRITHYKANDGCLELRGDHSQSAKTMTAILDSKRSLRSLMIDYFETKDNAGAVPRDNKEKEIGNLIDFITEKCDMVDSPLRLMSVDEKEMVNLIEFINENCENVNSPLNITQLNKDFNMQFGLSRSVECIKRRIKKYCHEIQIVEFLDTPSKVKQLFGLSATLDLDSLEKLRKEADIEVDNLNRITKYTANNGRLTLHGDHSQSAKRRLSWIVRRKNKKKVKKHCNSDGDKSDESETENGYSEEDSDEYSSEEFDSEFDSDDENIYPDQPDDHVKPSNKTDDFDNENPVRNRSPTELSIDDNLEFDPPTAMGEDRENDPGIMGNTSVKTRYGRLSKKRHLDTKFSYNLSSSRSSGAPISTDPASSKPAKQQKIAIEKEQASNSSSRRSSISVKKSSRDSLFPYFSKESEEIMENQDSPRAEENPSDYHGPPIQEMEDYDYNPKEDSIPDSSPIDNRFEQPEPPSVDKQNTNIEAQNTHNRSDAVAPKPNSKKESLSLQNETNSTTQTNGKEVFSEEVPVKVENKEPMAVEDSTEDVKPVTAHNPKIKFFEAMKSLILFLDTPSLSNLQSKIHQKIQKMKGSKEVLQNNELIPALELLIARMANHSVINISKSVKSVSLIQFFCYLKASILNSKMSGMEGVMNNISGLIEKYQNKRIPMEKVANALRATLDFDKF